MEPHMLHTDINELINDFRAYLSVIQDVHDARDARVSHRYVFVSWTPLPVATLPTSAAFAPRSAQRGQHSTTVELKSPKGSSH